jgi:hypothetical protein
LLSVEVGVVLVEVGVLLVEVGVLLALGLLVEVGVLLVKGRGLLSWSRVGVSVLSWFKAGVLSELLRAVGVVGGVRGSRSGVDEEEGRSA